MSTRLAHVLALMFAAAIGSSACGTTTRGSTTKPEPAPAIAPTGAATTSPPPPAPEGDLRAGVATVDVTPAIGAPIAGYTGRRRILPEFDAKTPTTYFKPSTGVRDPLRARALVLESGGKRITFVAVDAIAMVGALIDDVVTAAHARGSQVEQADLVVFASHSHSSSGALTGLHFWEQVATDALVPTMHDSFVAACADAIVTAEQSLVAAHAGFGWGELAGATKNRRANVSKTFTADSIDKTMSVLRVDDAGGKPLATLANFSIHPTALAATNFEFSADVIGGIAAQVEKATGAPLLFAQGAEGDIAPAQEGEAAIDALGSLVGQKILEVRDTAQTRDRLRLSTANATVDFGQATLVARPDTLSSGALDLSVLGPIGSIDLGPDSMDRVFRFQAVRIDDDVIAAIPGEPIHTLGLRVRADGLKLGFDHVLVFGLSNGYMSYVTDADEYDAGGYEAAATLFGRDTGDRLVAASVARLQSVSGQ